MVGKASNKLTPDIAGDSDRRIEIRTKARDIFMRYGYRKATIEDISNACGLTKSALYHYFESKEAVFAEVVRTESSHLLAELRKAVEAARDPKEKIRTLIKTRFRVVSSLMDNIMGDVRQEFIELHPRIARERNQYIQEETALIAEILEEGRQKGVFKAIESSTVPVIMTAAFRSIEVFLVPHEDSLSLDEGINALLDVFLYGLCV